MRDNTNLDQDDINGLLWNSWIFKHILIQKPVAFSDVSDVTHETKEESRRLQTGFYTWATGIMVSTFVKMRKAVGGTGLEEISFDEFVMCKV